MRRRLLLSLAGAVALAALVATEPAAAAPGSLKPVGPVALAMRSSLEGIGGPAAWAVSSAPLPTGDDWDWVDSAADDRAGDGRKSAARAMFSSAVLPGLGEQYLGHQRRAKTFYVIEGVIWSSFIFFSIQADDRQDRQIEYAVVNARAANDLDSDYYEHIGLWLSLEEWHDIVRRDARLNFPDDPAAQEAFFEENKRYDVGEYWSWPSDDERNRYRQLRSQAERSYRNRRLALGAAIFNRIASMVDALALTRSYNNRLEEAERASLELRIGPRSTSDGLVVGPVLNARY
jgi:hypothetical protein